MIAIKRHIECLLSPSSSMKISFVIFVANVIYFLNMLPCFLFKFPSTFSPKKKNTYKNKWFWGFSPLNLEEKHWEILVTSYKFRYSDSTKCYVSLCSELPWIFLCKISYCLDLFDLNNVAHNFHLTKKKNLFQNTMNNFVIHKFLIVPTIFA